MPARKVRQVSGLSSPLMLIGIGLLVTSILVGTIYIVNREYSFDIRKMAFSPETEKDWDTIKSIDSNEKRDGDDTRRESDDSKDTYRSLVEKAEEEGTYDPNPDNWNIETKDQDKVVDTSPTFGGGGKTYEELVEEAEEEGTYDPNPDNWGITGNNTADMGSDIQSDILNVPENNLVICSGASSGDCFVTFNPQLQEYVYHRNYYYVPDPDNEPGVGYWITQSLSETELIELFEDITTLTVPPGTPVDKLFLFVRDEEVEGSIDIIYNLDGIKEEQVYEWNAANVEKNLQFSDIFHPGGEYYSGITIQQETSLLVDKYGNPTDQLGYLQQVYKVNNLHTLYDECIKNGGNCEPIAQEILNTAATYSNKIAYNDCIVGGGSPTGCMDFLNRSYEEVIDEQKQLAEEEQVYNDLFHPGDENYSGITVRDEVTMFNYPEELKRLAEEEQVYTNYFHPGDDNYSGITAIEEMIYLYNEQQKNIPYFTAASIPQQLNDYIPTYIQEGTGTGFLPMTSLSMGTSNQPTGYDALGRPIYEYATPADPLFFPTSSYYSYSINSPQVQSLYRNQQTQQPQLLGDPYLRDIYATEVAIGSFSLAAAPLGATSIWNAFEVASLGGTVGYLETAKNLARLTTPLASDLAVKLSPQSSEYYIHPAGITALTNESFGSQTLIGDYTLKQAYTDYLFGKTFSFGLSKSLQFLASTGAPGSAITWVVDKWDNTQDFGTALQCVRTGGKDAGACSETLINLAIGARDLTETPIDIANLGLRAGGSSTRISTSDPGTVTINGQIVHLADSFVQPSVQINQNTTKTDVSPIEIQTQQHRDILGGNLRITNTKTENLVEALKNPQTLEMMQRQIETESPQATLIGNLLELTPFINTQTETKDSPTIKEVANKDIADTGPKSITSQEDIQGETRTQSNPILSAINTVSNSLQSLFLPKNTETITETTIDTKKELSPDDTSISDIEHLPSEVQIKPDLQPESIEQLITQEDEMAVVKQVPVQTQPLNQIAYLGTTVNFPQMAIDAEIALEKTTNPALKIYLSTLAGASKFMARVLNQNAKVQAPSTTEQEIVDSTSETLTDKETVKQIPQAEEIPVDMPTEPQKITSGEIALNNALNELAINSDARENPGYTPNSARPFYGTPDVKVELEKLDNDPVIIKLREILNSTDDIEEAITLLTNYINDNHVIVAQIHEGEEPGVTYYVYNDPDTGRLVEIPMKPDEHDVGGRYVPAGPYKGYQYQNGLIVRVFPSDPTTKPVIAMYDKKLRRISPLTMLTRIIHEYGHHVDTQNIHYFNTPEGKLPGYPPSEFTSSLYGAKAAMVLAEKDMDMATKELIDQIAIFNWVTRGTINGDESQVVHLGTGFNPVEMARIWRGVEAKAEKPYTKTIFGGLAAIAERLAGVSDRETVNDFQNSIPKEIDPLYPEVVIQENAPKTIVNRTVDWVINTRSSVRNTIQPLLGRFINFITPEIWKVRILNRFSLGIVQLDNNYVFQ
ncbi:hypothetical protein ACFL0F_01895, partial [Patescibacteria group bacterium]